MGNNREEYQKLRRMYYDETKCYAIKDLELYCDWLEDQVVNKNDSIHIVSNNEVAVCQHIHKDVKRIQADYCTKCKQIIKMAN